MIPKYKIIILICFVAIICNIAAKIYYMNEQNIKISMLQKKVSAVRSSSAHKSDRPVKPISTQPEDLQRILHTIPEEFSFTEYAARMRFLVDTSHLFLEKSLIFKPEKIKTSDLLKYNTTIVVTGNYIKIKKLISDIQNLPGISFINSASLVREKEDQSRIKLNLGVSVFFKKGTA